MGTLHLISKRAKKVSTKKPTACDVIIHQTLNANKGLEPEFKTFFVRRIK